MDTLEKMRAGIPFLPGGGQAGSLHRACQQKVFTYNQLSPSRSRERRLLLKDILGKCGEHIHIESPFHCDYGINIEVGEYFYANFNLVILDVGPVKIGQHVMFGPNVAIYTVGHPLHPETRNSGLEFGRPMSIGDNVWLGGNVVINPGVSVGSNVVVGSGSVLTRDVPDSVLVAGNPARVLRSITEEDRDFYYRGCPEFEADDD